MKAVILTEGGRKIGFGHLTRCIALYRAFKEKNIRPQLIINGDNSILYLLKGIRYRIVNWIEKENKIHETTKNSDFVVVDSYLMKKSCYGKLSQVTNGKLIMIDDNNRLNYPKGIVINPSIYGDKLNYARKPGVVYLLGKDYIILRKEFWDIPKKRINAEVKNILITLGGMNQAITTHAIVNFLKSKFNFNLYVVEPNKNRASAKEMLNLMLESDICISGGGQTIYELARIGIPTIGICFAENQRLNLLEWQKRGFIEYADSYSSADSLKKIAYGIRRFMPYERRLRSSKIGKSYVNGEGARTIINLVMRANYE